MPKYALVDGNAFYASCQIAFQPELKNRPVVVLSNNDGCIVAANDLAKALETTALNLQNQSLPSGYQASAKKIMFQPYFKVAALLKKHKAVIFSSNYELYADMSQRMHNISAQFASRQEIYSIDESFLDFSDIANAELTQHATRLKNRVFKWIGIPVAVGIGLSKTQAKLANHLAKKNPQFNGVLDLTNLTESTLNALYQKTQVNHVWGIGRQLSAQLISKGIHTAYDLKMANSQTLRRQFSVNLERTIQELNGQACLAFDEIPGAKKNIVSSRSFGELITDFNGMRQAVSSYTANAAKKLRLQNSTCQTITVSITTPPHQKRLPQYFNQMTIALIYPSDNTILLSKLAYRALKQIWCDGYQYQKASVTLAKIQDKTAFQTDLFAPNPSFSGNPKAEQLMKTLDNLNNKMGKRTIQLASSGVGKNQWKMKQTLMSPRYTTCWQEMVKVR